MENNFNHYQSPQCSCMNGFQQQMMQQQQPSYCFSSCNHSGMMHSPQAQATLPPPPPPPPSAGQFPCVPMPPPMWNPMQQSAPFFNPMMMGVQPNFQQEAMMMPQMMPPNGGQQSFMLMNGSMQPSMMGAQPMSNPTQPHLPWNDLMHY